MIVLRMVSLRQRVISCTVANLALSEVLPDVGADDSEPMWREVMTLPINTQPSKTPFEPVLSHKAPCKLCVTDL